MSSQVVEINEYSDTQLNCRFNSSPQASVSWRRDDGLPIKLKSGDDHYVEQVRGERLALSSVDRSMGGIYVCFASNGIPPLASKKIPLYVKCKYFYVKSLI